MKIRAKDLPIPGRFRKEPIVKLTAKPCRNPVTAESGVSECERDFVNIVIRRLKTRENTVLKTRPNRDFLNISYLPFILEHGKEETPAVWRN